MGKSPKRPAIERGKKKKLGKKNAKKQSKGERPNCLKGSKPRNKKTHQRGSEKR